MEKLDVVVCFDWLEKAEKVGTQDTKPFEALTYVANINTDFMFMNYWVCESLTLPFHTPYYIIWNARLEFLL